MPSPAQGDAERAHRLRLMLGSSLPAIPLGLLPRGLEETRKCIAGEDGKSRRDELADDRRSAEGDSWEGLGQGEGDRREMVAEQPRFVLFLGRPKQAIRVVDVSSSYTYREFQGSDPNCGDLVNDRTQFPALGSSVSTLPAENGTRLCAGQSPTGFLGLPGRRWRAKALENIALELPIRALGTEFWIPERWTSGTMNFWNCKLLSWRISGTIKSGMSTQPATVSVVQNSIPADGSFVVE